jgi:hypothetical protein
LRLTGNKAKGRATTKRGEIAAKDLLRKSEVELLRELYDTGMWSTAALADKFGISRARVESIAKYKTHA